MKIHHDAYLKEIPEIFGCHSFSALKRLRKLGFCKKKSTFYKEQASKEVEAYLEKFKDIPKENFVYIDETGSQTQMYRRYAHSKRGIGVNIRIRGKRQARIGFGVTHCEVEFVSPCIYDWNDESVRI